jgi:hypothetical protein
MKIARDCGDGGVSFWGMRNIMNTIVNATQKTAAKNKKYNRKFWNWLFLS